MHRLEEARCVEVRCSGCNKLFRVSDDKITGSGVKFKCSRCGETVKIARSDFEQYKTALSSLAAGGSAPVVGSAVAPAQEASGGGASLPAFDSEMPQTPAGVKPHTEEPPIFAASVPPVEAKPAVAAGSVRGKEPLPGVKAVPTVAAGVQAKQDMKVSGRTTPEPALQAPSAAQPKQETNLSPRPKAEQQAQSMQPPAQAAASLRPVSAQLEKPSSSGWGKKSAIIFIILLLIGAAFAGLSYFRDRLGIFDSVKQITSSEGLEVKNIAGTIDPVTQDLIITGAVENTTDKPKAAWYIVAEVYDAQGNVLIKGKLLNGKQLYFRRDYDIMMRRGVNILELKQKIVQEPGVIITGNGSAGFELHIMEPPVGIASFNALLQPFNPIELSKEMAAELK